MIKPQVVLFDLDGTLLDNSDVVVDAYYIGMQKFGYVPKEKNFIRSHLGKSTFETGRALGMKEVDLPKIDDHFWYYFGLFAENEEYKPKVYSGVKEIFDLLKMNSIPIGIVTSNLARYAKLLMQRVNLDSYISVYVRSEDSDEKKPSPKPLLIALKRLNISKLDQKDNSKWFVGDTGSDVEAANNAGIFSIVVPEEDKIQLVKNKNPDYLFNSLDELYTSLKNLF